MKNKIKFLTLTIFVSLLLVQENSAQLRIDDDGFLHIEQGNTAIQGNFSEVIVDDNGYYGYGAIYPNATGGNLGLSNKKWYNIYCMYLYQGSDKRDKKDISELKNSKEKLMRLKSFSYKFKEDSLRLSYGLLAQEVQQVIPELVEHDKENDIYVLNYIGFIPFLIDGYQGQQNKIDSLENELDILKNQVQKLINEKEPVTKSIVVSEIEEMTVVEGASLKQNSPNPFNENTIISFVIPKSFSSASLSIYEYSGKLLVSYPIDQNGEGEITVHGSEVSRDFLLYFTS